MKISIITPTTRPDRLSKLKQSIKKQTFKDYEHIIQKDEKREGAAITRNKALKKAKGKYIVFIDDDCEASEFWLKDMYDYLEHNPDIAGISGSVFYPIKSNVLQKAIYYLPMNDENTSMTIGNKIVSVDHVSCTNSMWRKKVLDDLEGFSDTLTRSQDLELGLRATRLGYRLQAIPDATVYHYYRDNLWDFLKQSFIQGRGGAMLMRQDPEYFGPRKLLIYGFPFFFFLSFLFPPLFLAPLLFCRSGFKAYRYEKSIKLFFLTTFIEYIKYYFNLFGIWYEKIRGAK